MYSVFTTFVGLLAATFSLLILARVLVSWTNPRGGGGLVAFLYQATEPILAPIRRILPPAGGFDLSPMVAILLLGIFINAFLR